MDSKTDSLTKICVNLYDADLQAIRKEAEAQDRDVSYIIRRIVNNYVSGETA